MVKIRVVEDLTRGELGDTGCTKTTTTNNVETGKIKTGLDLYKFYTNVCVMP